MNNIGKSDAKSNGILSDAKSNGILSDAKPNEISKQVRRYLDTCNIDEIDIEVVKSMISNNFEDIYHRKMMKQHLRKYLDDDVVESILPTRRSGNTAKRNNSIEQVIMSMLQDSKSNITVENHTDRIIKYIDKSSDSSNGALSKITRVRKMLILNNYIEIADGLLTHKLYKKIREEAQDEIHESLINKDNTDNIRNIPEFRKEIIVRSLNKLVDDIISESTTSNNSNTSNTSTSIMSYNTITLALINFAARPSELYNLYLCDGNIGGHLKQRGKDNTFKYDGILPYDKADILLSYIKKYPEYNFDYRLNPHKIDSYRKYLKDRYGVNPRDLRRIGSLIAIEDESNRVKRIFKQKNILRHQSEVTSVLHYN